MIKINGKELSAFETVKSIATSKGRVFINGEEIDLDKVPKITIEVTGNVDQLSVDMCEGITVKGNVSNVKTISGDVDVRGDVTGDVQTVSGDVEADNIRGNVKTVSGDIRG